MTRRTVLITAAAVAVVVVSILIPLIVSSRRAARELQGADSLAQIETALFQAAAARARTPFVWPLYASTDGKILASIATRCAISQPIEPGKLQYQIQLDVASEVAAVLLVSLSDVPDPRNPKIDSVYKLYTEQMPYRAGLRAPFQIEIADSTGFKVREIPVPFATLDATPGAQPGYQRFVARGDDPEPCGFEVFNFRSIAVRLAIPARTAR